MNCLSQNTSLLNTDPSHELAFFLSLLDAPFAPFMSSVDYASMMTNTSSWFYSFLRNALSKRISSFVNVFIDEKDYLHSVVRSVGKIVRERTEIMYGKDGGILYKRYRNECKTVSEIYKESLSNRK